jgi:hypothetical protein
MLWVWLWRDTNLTLAPTSCYSLKDRHRHLDRSILPASEGANQVVPRRTGDPVNRRIALGILSVAPGYADWFAGIATSARVADLPSDPLADILPRY